MCARVRERGAGEETADVLRADLLTAERLGQRRIHHVRDHRLRRVECPAGPPLPRGHERLEGAPEHFRVDGGVGPVGLTLAGGEAMRAEQLSEERAHRLVGEARGRMSFLERAASEQAAVQVWNAAERPRRRGTVARRCIQRAEEQRKHHAFVELPAACHAGVEPSRKKCAIVVEPALRFEKGEEDEPRHAEQGQLGAIIGESDRE